MALTKREISLGYDAIVDKMGLSPKFYGAAITLAGDLSGKVLDLGCGVGGLLDQAKARCPSSQYFGADISFVLTQETKKRNNAVRVFQGDIEYLPLGSAIFDVVLLIEVLEHLLDYQLALSEVCRVLRPGGTLVLTVPNREWMRYDRYMEGRLPFQPVDDHFFTKAELEDLLHTAGLDIETVRGWGSLSGRRGIRRLLEKVNCAFDSTLALRRKRLMIRARKQVL